MSWTTFPTKMFEILNHSSITSIRFLTFFIWCVLNFEDTLNTMKYKYRVQSRDLHAECAMGLEYHFLNDTYIHVIILDIHEDRTESLFEFTSGSINLDVDYFWIPTQFKINYYALLQQTSEDTSYLLTFLTDICLSIFKSYGKLNLPKREIAVLASELLRITEKSTQHHDDLLKQSRNFKTYFQRKCKRLSEILGIMYNYLGKVDDVRMNDSWKKISSFYGISINTTKFGIGLSDQTVEETLRIIKNFVKRKLLQQILFPRLMKICHLMCNIEGEIGYLASNFLNYIYDQHFTDIECVLKECRKLYDEYGILLSSLKTMGNARRIIDIGSEFVDTVIEMLKVMESHKEITMFTNKTIVTFLCTYNFISRFKPGILNGTKETGIPIRKNFKWFSEELLQTKEKLNIRYLDALFLSLFRIILAFLLVTHTQIVFLVETKHGTSLKVTRLVLFNCGDIERNPGPLSREFRKFYQTPLLHMIYRKLHIEPPPPNSLYTKGPPFFWNQYPGVTDAAFFNIPNVAKHNKEKGTCFKEEDCKKCFQRIIDILRHVMKEEMPDDLGKILRCYEDLISRKSERKENKEYYEQCEKEIEVWVLKKQKAKPQKDLSESKSEFELCLEHKLKSLESGIGTISAKETELMQRLICIGQIQSNKIGERKRRNDEICDDSNTPSNSKYRRQESDLPCFDDSVFHDDSDLLDSNLSPGSSFSKEFQENQSGISIPSLEEYDQEEHVLEKFLHKLCKELID